MAGGNFGLVPGNVFSDVTTLPPLTTTGEFTTGDEIVVVIIGIVVAALPMEGINNVLFVVVEVVSVEDDVALVTNSFGSYFSPKFSKRFESSSNTLRFASTDFTISDGGTSFKSTSKSLCLKRNFSDIDASIFARVSLPVVDSDLEPDHFSYFSTTDLIRSSNEGSDGLAGAASLSDELELSDGGRGGGEAGGGTCTGLGGGNGVAITDANTGGLVIAVDDEVFDLLNPQRNWAANFGNGKLNGPSFVRSRNRLGSHGTIFIFSGRSSHKGVPGRDPSILSLPECAVVVVIV